MNDLPAIPQDRHAEIVQSIYKDFEAMETDYHIITGRQDPDGHRYSGERCVWCGVNYLDHMLYANNNEGCTINQPGGICNERCPGPPEGQWGPDDYWWPLEKIDALLKEHRDAIAKERGWR